MSGESAHWETMRISLMADGRSPIPAIEHTSPVLASPGQERLYPLVSQIPNASRAFNISFAYRLVGPVDVSSLRRSVDLVVARHEALRTTLVERDAGLFQEILPPVPDVLRIVNLSLSPSDANDRYVRAASAEMGRQFNFAKESLARFVLYRLGEEEHVLSIVVHHLVADGWSLGIIVREIAAGYAAYSTGQPVALPPVRLQYRDFAHWQRVWMTTEQAQAKLEYWQRHLFKAPTGAVVPHSKSRPPVKSYRGRKMIFELSAAMSSALSAAAQRESVTVAAFTLFAFTVLIHQRTESNDVVVGVPMANRSRVPSSGCVGYFVTTHAVRARLAIDATLRDLLHRTARSLAQGVAHQDVPFARVVGSLHLAETESGLPPVLFRQMFVYHNQPPARLDFQHIDVEYDARVPTETSKSDLVLDVIHGIEKTLLRLEYDSDLYSEDEIRELAAHYELLLQRLPHAMRTSLRNAPAWPG